MTDLNTLQGKITLEGEIIELFQEGEVTCLKVKFKEFIFQIKSKDIPQMHLGDKITIESELHLDTFKEKFNNHSHNKGRY